MRPRPEQLFVVPVEIEVPSQDAALARAKVIGLLRSTAGVHVPPDRLRVGKPRLAVHPRA